MCLLSYLCIDDDIVVQDQPLCIQCQSILTRAEPPKVEVAPVVLLDECNDNNGENKDKAKQSSLS